MAGHTVKLLYKKSAVLSTRKRNSHTLTLIQILWAFMQGEQRPKLRLASSLVKHVRVWLFNYLPKLSDLLLKNCKRMFKIVEIVKNTCVKRYKRDLMLQWSQTLCSDSQKRLHFPITNQFSFWNIQGSCLIRSLIRYSFRRFVQRFLVKSGRSLWKHETI